MPNTLQLAIIQHPPVFLQLGPSIARAEELVAQAAAQGARVVVFPETWLPGYPVWLDHAPGAAQWDHPGARALYRLLADNAIVLGGSEHMRLLRLARRHQVYLAIGAHERLGHTLYNTQLLLAPDGETCNVHRKLMPTYNEKLIWGRGDGSTLQALTTPYGPIGGLICWEHWMPLARAAMHAQHETLHIAQWPAVGELHHLASRHYAFEGQCYVAAAGTAMTRGDVLEGVRMLGDSAAISMIESIPGEDDRWLQDGGSVVYGPDAEPLAGPLRETKATLTANLDLRRLAEGRMVLDTAGHYARPDIFELRVDVRPKPGVLFESDPER